MRLIDLAAVCRSTGLVVHEVDGWKQRSRRSNTQEYPPSGPKAVMCHHTASPPHTDGQRDVDYICYGSPVKPVANLYLSRQAEVWVCAAGPTNTNGAGHDWWGGGVPDNEMNSYAIGIEAANNGVGEPWPWTQQHAYIQLCAALCRAYKIPVNSVRAHAEWAPQRKIDPAGQSQYATGSATWDMELFRSDVSSFLYPTPPTPPKPPLQLFGEDMEYIMKPTFPEATKATPWLAVFGSGSVRRAVNADVKYAESKGLPIIEQDSSEQHAYLCGKFNV